MDDAWTRRARAIFGNPGLPGPITQDQFDSAQEYLVELGKTPWQAADYSAEFYWAYFHDLRYMPLQHDLFLHAFKADLRFS